MNWLSNTLLAYVELGLILVLAYPHLLFSSRRTLPP